MELINIINNQQTQLNTIVNKQQEQIDKYLEILNAIDKLIGD